MTHKVNKVDDYCSDSNKEKRFQDDYGFGRELGKVPARIDGTVSRWTYEDIMLGRDREWDPIGEKEKRFIKGSPSTFKGRRTGNIYSRKK